MRCFLKGVTGGSVLTEVREVRYIMEEDKLKRLAELAEKKANEIRAREIRKWQGFLEIAKEQNIESLQQEAEETLKWLENASMLEVVKECDINVYIRG